MTGFPAPEQPKKRRVRRTRKDTATPDDPSITVQQACDGAGTIAATPAEKKRRARSPRKRKSPVEISADMIAPDEPIVSQPPAQSRSRRTVSKRTARAEKSIPLAVPVGAPYPSTPARPVKVSALPMDIVSLRTSMLVPVTIDSAAPVASHEWQLPDFVWKARHALPKIGNALRRHPRAVGLTITAVLLGLSITMAAIHWEPSQRSMTEQPAAVPKGVAIASSVSAESAPIETDVSIAADAQSQPKDENTAPGVRIVDPSWDKKSSCHESAWPYIDQSCLLKDEENNDGKPDRKIGPRMIDARTRPRSPDDPASIGSATAIVPAAPKAQATDGVATPELDAEQQDEAAPKPVTDSAPLPVADTQTATISEQRSAPRVRFVAPQRTRKGRTFRRSDEVRVPAPSRVGSAKRKKQPYVAEARRRTTQRNVVSAPPQAQQFFFPFGWLVQAR